MTIRDILRGTTAGKIQTVGYMQVIPLISDIVDERFVSPMQAGTFKTNGYGNMVFKNDSQKTMIVPAHATYLTKESAQDHAMMHAGMVKSRMVKEYKTAACVQQTQGGHISEQRHEFMIMPFSLRETALKVRNTIGYNKLWPAISEFNKNIGLRQFGDRGHLEFFFKQFEKELDRFVAEFEVVPNQIGAIVLINGMVVGIERSPSHDYWASVWKALIRGCYGALAIEYDKRGLVNKTTLSKIRVPIESKGVKNLNDLFKAYEMAETKQTENVKSIVRNLVDDMFTAQLDEASDGMRREQIENPQFAGQLITEGPRIIYTSLIATSGWIKNKDWHKAEKFEI